VTGGKWFSATRGLVAAAIVSIAISVGSATALRAAQGNEHTERSPGIGSAAGQFPLGAQVYKANCAACHEMGVGRAPQRIVLNNIRPEAIRDALTGGSMQAQGSALSDEEKVAVAQFLAGREIGSEQTDPAPRMCEGDRAKFDLTQPAAFTGWGLDPENTHSVTGEEAGITPENVGTLKLKWAFAFPGANRARSQPAIGAGAAFVGSQDGRVYALDRETGCVRWTFQADAEVRTGIVLSQWDASDSQARPIAYFGDWAGNAYGIEMLTGKLVWQVEADEHPAAVITGTPALHGDTLYVPVSSLEEGSAASPNYTCCTFRGSVLALDAMTGETRWRTWLVGEPEPRKAESEGANDYYGPSGVAVWTSPAIDDDRGRIYITTGDNYTNPTNDLSDAVIALDMETGAIDWVFQATEGDAWNVACVAPFRQNCPEDAGPDFDFGASPVLTQGADGKKYILAGQKSGIAYAVDPDTGKLVWQERLGRGGAAGGIHFGMATADGKLFAPVSDLPDGQPSEFPLSPGVYALDIATGKRLWEAPSPDVCEGRKGCVKGYGGSLTATADLVFAGSDDGHMRIFAAADGKLLWDYDTARKFDSVNGIEARGGAISGGSAPIALGGQLFVNSGYGFVSKMPGNVLLVFEAD